MASNDPLVLALFINSRNRQRARSNLKLALDAASTAFHLFEFDVDSHPELVEAQGLLVSPTLVKFWPLPKITIIGELSDVRGVRELLYAHEVCSDMAILDHEQPPPFANNLADFPYSIMGSLAPWAKVVSTAYQQNPGKERR